MTLTAVPTAIETAGSVGYRNSHSLTCGEGYEFVRPGSPMQAADELYVHGIGPWTSIHTLTGGIEPGDAVLPHMYPLRRKIVVPTTPRWDCRGPRHKYIDRETHCSVCKALFNVFVTTRS